MLYGLLGSGGSKEKIVAWDDDEIESQKISALGTDVLGAYSLGAVNPDINDSYAFSIPIAVNVKRSSRYKIKIETYYDADTTPESYWAISNMSTNPRLLGLDGNQVVSSNG